jgi:hypothetical protein
MEPRPASQSPDREEPNINCMLIIFDQSQGFMIGREGQFSRELQHNHRVYMRCEKHREFRVLRDDESICRLSGRESDVKRAVINVLKKMAHYDETNKSDLYEKETFMVIGTTYVTKIIGVGGINIK